MFEEIRKRATKEQQPILKEVEAAMKKNGHVLDSDNLELIAGKMYELVMAGSESYEHKTRGQVDVARSAIEEITRRHLATLFGQRETEAAYEKNAEKLVAICGSVEKALRKINAMRQERRALFFTEGRLFERELGKTRLDKALEGVEDEQRRLIHHHWLNQINLSEEKFRYMEKTLNTQRRGVDKKVPRG